MFSFRELKDELDGVLSRGANFNLVFTRPEKFDHKHIPASCTPQRYLDVVRQNVKAEFWCMFKKLVTPVFPGWRSRRLTEYKLQTYQMETDGSSRRVMKSIQALQQVDDAKKTDIQEVVKHLVVWKGRLFITTTSSADNNKLLLAAAGALLDDDYPDNLANRSEDALYSLGYIGSFLQQLRACDSLQTRLQEPIVMAVADPMLRQSIVTTHGVLDPRVPCNTGQRAALDGFHRNIEGLQGPPGTGKSTVIFHIVTSLLTDGKAALVTCVQNRAVDSIAERLSRAEDNVRFFVVGNPARLGPTASMFLIDSQVERRRSVVTAKRAHDHFLGFCTAIQRGLEAIRKRWLSKKHEDHIVERAQRCKDSNKPVPLDCWAVLVDAYLRERHRCAHQLLEWLSGKASAASQRLVAARQEERTLLLTQAKAVLCSVATIPKTIEFLSDPNSDVCQLVHPIDTAIVDEAGTVSEQEVPMLLMMGAVRIISIGDQCQLAPFTYADQRSYTPVGFFQRIDTAYKGSATPIPMLTEQYRMHPTISSVVSRCFYSNKLITPSSIVRERVCPQPLVWLDCTAYETNVGTSKVNWGEVKFAAALVPTMQQNEIAVISFYKTQVKLLEQCVVARHDQRVVFLTADACQGSEYDAVILSCVRSNDCRTIGFLSNPSRLCVAFSRAKEQQMIIGNLDTITRAGCGPLSVLAQIATRNPEKQRWLEQQPTPNAIQEKQTEHEEREKQKQAQHNVQHTHGRGGRQRNVRVGRGGKGYGHGKGGIFRGGGKGKGKGRARDRFFDLF